MKDYVLRLVKLPLLLFYGHESSLVCQARQPGEVNIFDLSLVVGSLKGVKREEAAPVERGFVGTDWGRKKTTKKSGKASMGAGMQRLAPRLKKKKTS